MPSTGSAVMQKVLIRKRRRTQEEQQKDSYYIYEVAVLFRDSLDKLNREMKQLEDGFHNVGKWFRDFRKELSRLFESPESTGRQEAVLIVSDSYSA